MISSRIVDSIQPFAAQVSSETMKIEQEHTQETATRVVRRRGAVLVLVLFFLVLAGSLSFLVTASSVQLVRTTRHEHESIVLRQLADSAEAWVSQHGGLPGGDKSHSWASVTFHAGEILPEGICGSVRIRVDGELQNILVIRAQLSLPGRVASRTTRFPAPP